MGFKGLIHSHPRAFLPLVMGLGGLVWLGVVARVPAEIVNANRTNSFPVLRFARSAIAVNRLQLAVAALTHKRYQVQASESVSGPWAILSDQVAATNGDLVFSVPIDRSARFFRVLVLNAVTNVSGLGQSGRTGGSATSRVTGVQARTPVRALLSAALAPTAPSGTGLTGQYFTNASPVYTNAANFNPANLFLTTNDATIDFTWGPGSSPNLSNGFYTVSWTGQIQPEFSETYVFETRTDDGVVLWVNDQPVISHWWYQVPTSLTNSISLLAGVRYDIRMDYCNLGGGAQAHLFWYSPSQPRQLVPTERLYPSTGPLDPGAITSPLTAVAFAGQPFQFTVTAANAPFGFGASNLPPGLQINSTNGVISGVPGAAGLYDVALSATNPIGAVSATLALEVLDTGNCISREVWMNVPGASVTNIPLDTLPSVSNTLSTLEGIPNFGDNYGERIRGYMTPPVTGNYYFWIAANNTAELWISNDQEPANKVRRAVVSVPTAPRQWTLKPGQKSAWLSLVAGQQYYIEILHKAASGSKDHWSVGWLLDPVGTNAVPAGVVPGYVLSPFANVSSNSVTGTLYSAGMLAQAGIASSGVGSATLRVSDDGSQAVLNFTYTGLSSAVTGQHIHSDPYLNNAPQILFDIDSATPQPDGSYIWNIVPAGTLSTADILEIIREGKAYMNVHTVNYPGGEISGHFSLAAGVQDFTPPPPPPVWKDDHSNSNAAARFLMQSTFGPRMADVEAVRAMGYSGWINHQFSIPMSSHLRPVMNNLNPDPEFPEPGYLTFNTWWRQSVTAPDQLRQRVAFALSEIMVVSENGTLQNHAISLSSYYDILLAHAFGNFRDLLKTVTLSPAMGCYLDMRRNDKGDMTLGTHPDENYARELMQLFSIGLNRMWPDGTLVLDSSGNLVPTYNQDVVMGFAKVFTGWNYYQTNGPKHRLPTFWNANQNETNPMVLVPLHHELGTKQLLDNIVLPAAQGSQADPNSTNFDAYGLADLDLAIDVVFNNQNVGPFICRQLIQHLVTSNPSRDYLYRVVQKFNDNGAGVRGDLKAVIRAILLDYEARSPDMLLAPTFGKQREPLLRATAVARAFSGVTTLPAAYHQDGGNVITLNTLTPHRLSSSDSVLLTFTSLSGTPAPMNQVCSVAGVSNRTTFAILAPGLSVGTYGQTGGTVTVTNSGHYLAPGYQVYLDFTSGGAQSGIYTVVTAPNNVVFTAAARDSSNRSGRCFFPKWSFNGGSVQSGHTITVTLTGSHGLAVGDEVYIHFWGGKSNDGRYRVATVPAPNRFTVNSNVSMPADESGPLVLPLVPPPLVRSGNAVLHYDNWLMNYTDGGSTASLSQTPLDSPTVFNYFSPDYRFPGILASAGLTTPEFQLTGDSSVIAQMNFLLDGVFSNGANTNGLSSFSNGSGAITLDLGPWMTPRWTSNTGIPNLVDALSMLLCGGNLSPEARNILVTFASNNSYFPYTTPTQVEMRDRVKAVVYLIVASPDFTIQR